MTIHVKAHLCKIFVLTVSIATALVFQTSSNWFFGRSHTLFFACSCSVKQLRTVPTFVSAHTFCTSHKAWFKCHMRARVDNDAINYATRYTTKMKAKFSYSDQIKFNEPVLKPGTPQYSSISLSTNCYCLPAEKLSVIFRKLYWNPTVNMYLQMA